MTYQLMVERLREYHANKRRLDLFEAIVANAERNFILSENKAVERDADARKLISSLAEQTQSASELEACKRWLGDRS